MEHQEKQTTMLYKKLDELREKQDNFQKEIDRLELEISRLHISESEKTVQPAPRVIESRPHLPTALEKLEGIAESLPKILKPDKNKIEQFVGENLMNKIGIIILVLGISIGVKYAIDHDMISPVVRIILGYLAGFTLLFFAWRLKKKYISYSAVLLSGAMASMYFITYAAFAYYDLIPRWLTFGLMVLFTIFTVMASLAYNRQVIAHIGLVGAYAIPFLLNDPESKISFLFSYMAIINAGILLISYFKYWKYIYYSAFVFTWLIYFYWYIPAYNADNDLGTGLFFATLFFLLFYAILLLYKLFKQQNYTTDDILFLVANSTIFFGIGFSLLESHVTGEKYTGLFSLINALMHGGVAFLLFVKKPADKIVFYFTAGLAILCFTIAVPAQFSGNWVTLIWAGEAALLFWIGRKNKISVWEILSCMLMVLAFFSLLHDWALGGKMSEEREFLPIFNTDFLTSVVFIVFFAVILWIRNQYQLEKLQGIKTELNVLFSYLAPAIFLIVFFFMFFREIGLFWDQLIFELQQRVGPEGEWTSGKIQALKELNLYKGYWQLNYTMFFVAILSYLNLIKIKSKNLGIVNLLLYIAIFFIFMAAGLKLLGDFRESYLTWQTEKPNPVIKIFLRHLSFILLGAVMYCSWRTLKEFFYSKEAKLLSEFVFYLILLVVVSSELINWMDIAGSTQSNKLGLSILWGVFSSVLILMGILKKRKHLRIWAIVLFGITLVKLFFYDLRELDTVSKTIVFVILGILLLIISFLYNKFKSLIFDENTNTTKSTYT